ncbi:MAG: hypothetical protein V4616_02375, partial [Bacteroidota bacterium]
LARCLEEGITTPIIAVGGIQLDDVQGIISTGISGIAVSGLITNASDKQELITELNQVIASQKEGTLC